MSVVFLVLFIETEPRGFYRLKSMNLLFDTWWLNFCRFLETRKIEQAPCSNEESHRDPKELG